VNAGAGETRVIQSRGSGYRPELILACICTKVLGRINRREKNRIYTAESHARLVNKGPTMARNLTVPSALPPHLSSLQCPRSLNSGRSGHREIKRIRKFKSSSRCATFPAEGTERGELRLKGGLATSRPSRYNLTVYTPISSPQWRRNGNTRNSSRGLPIRGRSSRSPYPARECSPIVRPFPNRVVEIVINQPNTIIIYS